MMRVCVQRFSLLCGVIFIGTLTSVSAQSKTIDLSSTPDSHSHVIELSPFPDSQTKRMTVDDVIKMSKARLSDDVIIQQLKKEGQYFNLTNDQLLKLKTAHVSKQVIQVMVDPYPIRDSPPSSPEKTAVQSAHGEGCTDCIDRCTKAYDRCVADACGAKVYHENIMVCENAVRPDREDQFNHEVVINCGGQRVRCATHCGSAGGPCSGKKP
jgi:hypothetical protein